MEFNELHPEYYLRERGWEPEPNPFMPRPRIAGHGYIDKRIFIYIDQLWYDIDATTGMVGRARRGNQTNQEDMIPTSENDEDRPLFYRWFDKYLRKVESMLSAYIITPAGRTRDNALKEWKEKELWLRFPDYWDETKWDALTKSIHDYIVSGALLEYFMLTLTNKDPLTIDKANQLDEAELDIMDAANSTKPGSMIRQLKPFG